MAASFHALHPLFVHMPAPSHELVWLRQYPAPQLVLEDRYLTHICLPSTVSEACSLSPSSQDPSDQARKRMRSPEVPAGMLGMLKDGLWPDALVTLRGRGVTVRRRRFDNRMQSLVSVPSEQYDVPSSHSASLAYWQVSTRELLAAAALSSGPIETVAHCFRTDRAYPCAPNEEYWCAPPLDRQAQYPQCPVAV